MNEVQDIVMSDTKDVHVARVRYFVDASSVVMEAEVGNVFETTKKQGSRKWLLLFYEHADQGKRFRR